MAAVLTSTGVTFGDSTSLNSKYGIVPQTSSVTFYQSSAPTGWTRVTTHNDKALRVVSGTGAGSGGTNSFSSTFGSKPISATVPVTINGLSSGATTIDVNTMASHAHPANSGGNIVTNSPSPSVGTITKVANSGNTGNNGNSGSHSHPIAYTSASGPLSTSTDFSVQYIDIIYCTFN
jgi:hypothetical protein